MDAKAMRRRLAHSKALRAKLRDACYGSLVSVTKRQPFVGFLTAGLLETLDHCDQYQHNLRRCYP
jgi:hypothetical protein